MGFVLGIDVSTTATKAVLVDEPGASPAIASPGTGSSSRNRCGASRTRALWWAGAAPRSGACSPRRASSGPTSRAVGLTGQMHGLVLLDAAGEVLRPAILWNDQRTAAECDAIRAAVGPRAARRDHRQRRADRASPRRSSPGSGPTSPTSGARVAHVLLPKDYVRLRLTGEYAMDKADGAGTLLFDLAARDWSPVMLDALGIDPSWMPPTFEGPEVTGTVTAEAAAATGPARRDAGHGGRRRPGGQRGRRRGRGRRAGRAVARDVGRGVRDDRRAAVEPAGRVHAFCHAVPGRWHLMSVMLSAAGSLRWFRDAVAPGRAFDDLVDGGRRGAGRAATASCSCRTCRASAARTRTRTRAARSSG